ncbi:MAG: pyridoxal phosphate-dependent aminotransferase, partial [Roseovarius sp.]
VGAKALIQSFDKIRNHFGMNRASQAGALAALDDQAWLRQVIADVGAARVEIARIAAACGLHALPSATNFVTVDCGADGDFARRVLADLVDQGLFVRMPFVAPQDRCIRVGCGTPVEMALFEAALPRALMAARSAAP